MVNGTRRVYKAIKITRICDSNELTKCFEDKILTEDPKEIDITTLSTSGNFTKDNWGTETVGVQFANGVNALIAYNPNTTQEPYNNQFSATAESMAILYDVSGNKNPNTIGKDINQNANVKKLGCQIKPDLVGGMCINQILAPGTGYSPLTQAQCEEQKGDLGIDACYDGNDYWGGALKACGGVQNMPTQAQLTALAEYLYPDADSIDNSGNTNALWDADRASLFKTVLPGGTYSFRVWSGQLLDQDSAYDRSFSYASTSWGRYFRGHSTHLAVCLDQ